MKKLSFWAILSLVALTLFGCMSTEGGGGDEQSASSNQIRVLSYEPIAAPAAAHVMAAAVGDPVQTGKAIYRLGFPKAIVYASKDHPFVRSSKGNWQSVAMVDDNADGVADTTADGLCWIGEFTVYDEIVELNYGGDYLSTPVSYADLSLIGGGLYNAATGTLEIGFHQGGIFNKTDFPAPIAVPPMLVHLVSSELLPSGAYRYIIDFSFDEITDVSAPFVMGDFTAWTKVPLVIGANGMASYSVDLYNAEQKFTFGGNMNSAQGYAVLEGCEYYVATDNALVASFFNGAMLHKGGATPVAYGGTATDTGNVVGYTMSADLNSLTLYVNLAGKVSGSLSAPFIDVNGVRSVVTIDSNGWGSITVPVVRPQFLFFNFGTGAVGAETYATISGSQWFIAALGSHTNTLGVYVKPDGTLELPTAYTIGIVP